MDGDDWRGEGLIKIKKPEATKAPIRKANICQTPGCDQPLRYLNRKGLCEKHRRTVCGLEGCDAKLSTRNISGYCRPHVIYKQRTKGQQA